MHLTATCIQWIQCSLGSSLEDLWMSIDDYYEHGASLMHEKVASWSV